jgi:PmbA protein
MGFAYLSAADDDSIATAVRQALESARHGDEAAFPFAGAAELPADPCVPDPDFDLRGPGVKEALVADAVARAWNAAATVSRVRKATYAERRWRRGLVTSAGFEGVKEGTSFSFGGTILARRGEDTAIASEWVGARDFSGLKAATALEEAAGRADALLGGGSIPTGRQAAVLHPSVAVEMLSVFASALSGEMVAKGKSRLAGKVGEAVAAEGISVVSDGLLAGGYDSEPFDDEGTPRGRRFLVEGGVLRGFLLNRKAASLLGLPPSGDGGRGDYRGLPGISPANLHVAPGSGDAVSLMRQMGSGIWIVDVLGAHTMDPVSGTVSLGAIGFVVEGGAPVRPFRGVTVAGNLFDLLRGVRLVGADLRFYGGAGSPSLLLEQVDVAGQG